MDAQELFDMIRRDAVSIYSEDSLLAKLQSGRKLTVKLGADPSRPDLHLGHAVVLRKLRLFQEAGHDIVFVIGDFTGMIGDPSGRSKTRPPLTFEETRLNAKSYFEQVAKLLDKSRTTVAYNSSWLERMNFADVLLLAGKYTLARIMERDDFAKRWAENQSIGLHELFYPLMQGYDSVALRADIEVGGTDQTFNLLVGRELQRDYGQEPQDVVTFPLLAGLDGREKMSKSLNNTIGISEAPEVMFEKCMKIPDQLMCDYFRLTTDVPAETYAPMVNGDIREAHFEYARTIVGTFHGPEHIAAAEHRYGEIARGKLPDDVKTLTLDAERAGLVEVVTAAGFASSNSDARRLIAGGGIKVDGETVYDAHLVISENVVISRGKNRFVRVSFKTGAC